MRGVGDALSVTSRFTRDCEIDASANAGPVLDSDPEHCAWKEFLNQIIIHIGSQQKFDLKSLLIH